MFKIKSESKCLRSNDGENIFEEICEPILSERDYVIQTVGNFTENDVRDFVIDYSFAY